MQGVSVFLRDSEADEGIFLCEVPFTEIGRLRDEIAKWGVFTGEDVDADPAGQFRLTESNAYFEIIVGG